MGRNKTGYSANTKENLLLGAGAIFKNWTIGTDSYGSSTSMAKVIGATQGGVQFSAVPTVRNIQIDGILGKAADLDVIDSWEIKMTASFIEASEDIIRLALGASTVDTTTNNNYDIIKGNTEFQSTDYLTNVTYVGTISGSETPIIIQLYNAINQGGLTIKTEDTAEGTIEITFEGRYTTSNQGEAPFAIYYPKASSDGE